MPFNPDEARTLQKAHPDSIILALVKNGMQKVMLIPKVRRKQTVRFGGMDLELGMLHGGTYYADGDRVEQSVRANEMVIARKRGKKCAT